MHLLNDLLENQIISEIMINAPNQVWIKQNDTLLLTDIDFKTEEVVMQIAYDIAYFLDENLNDSNSIVDTFLPDRSRVHIVVPPVSPRGTTITIIKTCIDENKWGTMLKIQ